MYDYKPNSHKTKEEGSAEKRDIKKVVTGPVKTKKKSGTSKFMSNFVSDDAQNVKSYILSDVLIPAAKKLLYDIVTDSIDMILYGNNGGSNRKKAGSGGSTSYVSYSNYSNKDRRDDRRENTTRVRFDFEDIIFGNRGEAEAVREQMEEVIDRYGFVTVADMYDMADISAPYTSSKYGWTNIRSAEVVRVRDGYILKLSRPAAID